MSKLRHVLARRYRKIDGTDEEEKVLVRPEESRRCDTLIDPKTGHPLFLRAENSKDVKPHFALKEKLSDYDRKIKEEISLKTPDDITHEYAQELIKRAFNRGIDILIYLKKCGKHHDKIPIRFIDLRSNGCVIKLEVTISGTHKRWDVLIINPYTSDIILGIEVYNTHRTDETSRPSNVPWVELDANKIINDLENDLAIPDVDFDINTKNFKFYCMRSFINSSEINKCNICIEEEIKIKNQEEQERRQKEVEERRYQYRITQELERKEREEEMRQYRIRQELERKEIEEKQELVRKEREEEMRQYRIRQELERKEREEKQELERKEIEEKQELERKEIEEKQEQERKKIEEERQQYKKKQKKAERELKKISRFLKIHNTAVNNIWKEKNENHGNETKLKEIKESEQILINLKLTHRMKEQKLVNEINHFKYIINKHSR